jgi:hypothetical protein
VKNFFRHEIHETHEPLGECFTNGLFRGFRGFRGEKIFGFSSRACGAFVLKGFRIAGPWTNAPN